MKRIILALFGALLACVALTSPARAETEDPNLNQTVGADETQGTGRVELKTGHVDIGPRMPGGTWSVQVRDDTATPPVWRSLDDVLIRVSDAALLEIPDDPNYKFLGVDKGKKVHVVPQTQNQKVIWLGWNTQDPAVTKAVQRGAKLRFNKMQGPGSFHVFLQSGSFDPPQQLWSSDKGAGQEIWVDVNTHTHANWVFSAPGVYLVDMSITAKGIDGDELSADATLRFAVGNAVSADEAFAASFPGATPTATGTPSAAQSGAPSSAPASAPTTASSPATANATESPAPAPAEDQGSFPIAVVIAGVAAVLLAAGAAFATVRSRRAKAEANRLLHEPKDGADA